MIAGRVLLMLAVVSGPAFAQEPATTLPAVIRKLPADSRCTWIVRSIRQRPAPLAEPERRLAEAGRETPDHLVQMLRDERVPAYGEEGEQIMSIYQRELIRDAMVEIGAGRILPLAVGSVARHGPVAERAVAIEMLGLLGGHDALRSMIRFAEHGAAEGLERRIEDRLQQAITDFVERYPIAVDFMRDQWRNWEPELMFPVLMGVGQARNPRAVALLTDVITWRDDLASVAMSQLRLVGRSGNEMMDERASETVLELLDPESPQLCAAAILALGALEHVESVPVLLELLESDSRGYRENALHALREISDMRLANRPELWRAWFRKENEWFEEGRHLVIERLASPLEHQVVSSLRDLGRHPLYRHELADEIGLLLYDSSPLLRERACQVLGKLGSRNALTGLVDALDDREEGVASAAQQALIRITGVDQGEDADRWRDALGLDF